MHELAEQTEQCVLIQDLLPLYLEDEVSPESHLVIANHLSTCQRCNGFLAGTRAMYDIVQRERQVRSEIIAKDSDQQTLLAGKRLVLTSVVVLVAIIVVGAIVVLMFLGPMLFKRPGI
jgi:predicted anti-sigma-YlaC factor YlaD